MKTKKIHPTTKQLVESQPETLDKGVVRRLYVSKTLSHGVDCVEIIDAHSYLLVTAMLWNRNRWNRNFLTSGTGTC